MGKHDLELTILGGAHNIGANSCLLEYAGECLVLDYGMDPSEGAERRNPLPVPEGKNPLALILSHCHLDHSGSVPFFRRRFPGVPVCCTSPTPEMVNILHTDMYKIAREKNIDCGISCPQDINSTRVLMEEHCLDVLRWYQLSDTCRVRMHPAGHVPGAAITEIEWRDLRVVYTGDFCCHDQGLVRAASTATIPPGPDLLICEGTYAGEERDSSWRDELSRLKDRVLEIIGMHGIVLLPAFAVGRSQELVHEFGRASITGELPGDTFLFIDGLARGVCRVSARLPGNEAFKKSYRQFGSAVERSNHNTRFRVRDRSIMVASSGMLHDRSIARRFLNQLMDEDYDLPAGVFISGWLDEASRAKWELLRENAPRDNFTFDEFNLSAHASSTEILSFAEELKPSSACMVHWGSQGDDESARDAFLARLEKSAGGNCLVHAPAEGQVIRPVC